MLEGKCRLAINGIEEDMVDIWLKTVFPRKI